MEKITPETYDKYINALMAISSAITFDYYLVPIHNGRFSSRHRRDVMLSPGPFLLGRDFKVYLEHRTQPIIYRFDLT